MEYMKQKLAHAVQPIRPSENKDKAEKPTSAAPPIEILSSDDEDQVPRPAVSKSKPKSTDVPKPAKRAEPSPFLPPPKQMPTGYVDGKPVGVRADLAFFNKAPAPPPVPAYASSGAVPIAPRPPQPLAPGAYPSYGASSNGSSQPSYTSAPSTTTVPSGSGDGEQFTLDATQPVYEQRVTSDQATKEMQEFLQGSIGAIDMDSVNMDDSNVEGFAEGIRLMPHQIQGRAWMRERESGKKSGGILADMGLGKTIQSLARIVEGKPTREELRGSDYSKANLIVCPVSVLPQWAEEVEKMTKGLSVIRHHGPGRTTNPEILKRADVVITTYSTLTSEHKVFTTSSGVDHSKKSTTKPSADKDELDDSDDSLLGRSIKKKAPAKKAGAGKKKLCALFEVGFWRIILDEAQNIKNKSSKAALSCFELKAKYRWVLTGTPIQNSVDELYPLFRFLRVRPLNDWDNFSSVISKPVKDGRSKNAMKRLHVVLSAIMLRRTKTQEINGKPIIVLPPRTVEVIPCEFDEEERAFYKAVEDRTSLAMNKFIEKGTVMENYTSVLVLLLRLRQACDHPALLSKDFVKDLDALESKVPAGRGTGADDEEENKKEVDELADMLGNLGIAKAKCSICMEELPKDWTSAECEDCQATVGIVSRRKSILAPSPRKKNPRVVADSSDDDDILDPLPPTSTKIRKTLEILEAIYQRNKGKRDEEGKKLASEKTIVFSQFTTMLDLLEPFLMDAGIRYTRFDGSMKPDAREEALNKLRNDRKCRVILISFKAGGVGLNLTACNNVILLDLWWNPALEDQAFDRAHRLGQKKNVSIYKLTVTDSVEDRILKLQETKRALAAAALSGGKLAKGGLNMQELMQLFTRASAAKDDDSDED